MLWPPVGSTSTMSPGLAPMGLEARARISSLGRWVQPAQAPSQCRPHSICRSRETSTTPSRTFFLTIAF